MGKRKVRKENQETLISPHENGEIDDETEEINGKKFFACYLLTSVCPRFKGHTYIGFTVNPRRRIRQHNGEIGSGAWRTKRKRPWEMVLCIYGFPTNVAALQFEWAWQHPAKSLAAREAAASLKSVSGLANKIKLAYTMLTLPAWQNLNLTVNLFSTKYQTYTSSCPTLPPQMQTRIQAMDDLPCYNGNYTCMSDDEWEIDEECDACDSFHPSTVQESTAVIETVHESLSNQGSSEGNVDIRMNHKDDISCCGISGCSEETFVADKESVPIKSSGFNDEVEIIDILTPSPGCRVDSGCKRRRPAVYPEIIDLTNSPMYV